MYNQEQSALINAPIDQVVVGASAAGSGKTYTMLGRTKRILEEYKTGRVLLISFTRSAATDMRERLKIVLQPDLLMRVTSGTFHSVLGQIIRDQAVTVGLNPNFTIIDEASTNRLYRKIFERNQQYLKQLEDWFLKEPDAKLSKNHFNKAAFFVSYLINNAEPEELLTGDFSSKTYKRVIRNIGPINQRNVETSCQILYEVFKESINDGRQNNVVNYDHILFIAYLMGKNGLLDVVKQKYLHTMIDEFQDTNTLQVAITQMIAGNHLTIIGDIDQSIYSFRGGRPDLMEKLSEQALVINLPTNYRSYQPILDIGNKVIKRNVLGREYREPMKAGRQMDEGYAGIKWAQVKTDTDEAKLVITYIKALHQMGVPYHEMAILARSRMALPIMNTQLSVEQIPVNDTTKFADFMNSEVVVDLLNFLKILTNPKDVYAFYNTIDRPKRGIGEKAITTLEEKAKEKELGLVEYILSPHTEELTPGLRKKVDSYKSVYIELLNSDKSISLISAIEMILEKTGYLNWVAGLKNNGRYYKHIEMFKEMTVQYMEEYTATHENFTLHDIAVAFVFEMANTSKSETPEGVCISTVHSAKGLEWRYVFLIGMEEGVFPMFTKDDEDEEDERRLMYVALTRAKDGIVIVSSKSRVTVQRDDDLKPSRFMKETGISAEQIKTI